MTRSSSAAGFRRRRLWAAGAALVALFAGAALIRHARPQTLVLTGESEHSTPAFRLASGRYSLHADLLSGCQYTFYLTPEGQRWTQGGRPIAGASGESSLTLTTPPLRPGRYFVHGYTAPEEGCSWTLSLSRQERQP